MLRFAADENFNNDIVRGLLRRKPHLDIVRVQDAGLSGADDSTVLEWTAREGRILLTHDVSTMTHYAYGRIQLHKPMPGIFEVSRNTQNTIKSYTFLTPKSAKLKHSVLSVPLLSRSTL